MTVTDEKYCSEMIEEMVRIQSDPDTEHFLDCSPLTVYTEHSCWYLAWWLHQLGGWEVVTMGGFADEQYFWVHAGVMVDGQFLDVMGLQDPELAMMWLDDWPGEDHGIYPLENGDDFAVVLFDPSLMSPAAAAATKEVAEGIIARAGLLATA